MDTTVISIKMPPSVDEGLDTEQQRSEEQQIKQEFLDYVSPRLDALLANPVKRSGNVRRIELLGPNVWPSTNHYLLLISFDIGVRDIDLKALVPPGGKAKVIGSYRELGQWPEPPTD